LVSPVSVSSSISLMFTLCFCVYFLSHILE
jgi:hypothetical protein